MTNPSDEAGTADLDTLLAQAQAQVEQEPAATDADEGGPGDEPGELPEDEATFADEEESDDSLSADDDFDDEPEDDDDEDLDDEDLDDDEPEDDLDEDDDEPSETEQRLLALEKQLQESAQRSADLERQNQQLLELVSQGAVPKEQPRQQRDPEFMAAWRAANIHGAEGIKDFDPKIQREVGQLAQQLAEARADWALNPEAEYETRFAPLVNMAIQAAIGPLIEDRRQAELQALMAPHADFLDEHRDLVLQHLPGDFGAKDPNDPRVLKQRLETAVALAKAKLAEGGLRKREQKVKTKSRQQEAKRRSRKQGSRRKPRKGRAQAPKIGGVDGDAIDAMARRLAADPAALKEAERRLRR